MYSHDDAARVLLLRLGVEHLALRAQPIALRDQVVNLLAAFQHTFNGLVHDLLCVVQLPLYLRYTVHFCWVLVCPDVGVQFGQGKRSNLGLLGGDVRVRGARMFRNKLVAYLAEEGLGNSFGILLVGNDDAADTFRPPVRMNQELIF